MSIGGPGGIGGVGPLAPVRSVRRRFGSPAFDVAAADQPEASATAPPAAAGLFALQEDRPEDAMDREARRHGQALLAALESLQHAALGTDGQGGLERLAGLLRAMPQPADPRLAVVQKAIHLRAAVELARARLRHPRDTP